MSTKFRCFLCPDSPVLTSRIDDWVAGYEIHYARDHYLAPSKPSPDRKLGEEGTRSGGD